MADPTEAGTPQATPPVSESAGTGAVAADGSESAGKPVDHALAMAWKAKAERVNELEQRLANVQQQQYAQQPNPLVDTVAELQQTQAFDANSRGTLFALAAQATNAAENWLTGEMVKARVPAEKWDAVAGLVRQSKYQTSVAQAMAFVSGSEVPDLQRQLEAERTRSAALQKALDGQTVGKGAQGNPAQTTPAAANAGDALSVTLEEYRNLPKELRDKASIKR